MPNSVEEDQPKAELDKSYTIPACQYDRVLARRAFKTEKYGPRTSIGRWTYEGRHLHAKSRPRLGGTGRFTGKEAKVDDAEASSEK